MTQNRGGATVKADGRIVIAALSFFHLFLSFALFWTKVQDGYYWIDHGTDAPPRSAVVRALLRVLPQPADYISRRLNLQKLPALSSVLALSNSLLWGVAGYIALRCLSSLHKRAPLKR